MNKSMSTYYSWVDIIKGTAIIGVVLSHITHPFKNYPLVPLVSLMYGLGLYQYFLLLVAFS